METRKFRLYATDLAKRYNTEIKKDSAGTLISITLDDSALANLMQDFKEKSYFLQLINWLPVRDISGKKLFSALNGTITGRKQIGRHRGQLENEKRYETVEIDSGVAIPWRLIDELDSTQTDFAAMYERLIENSFILDMLKIGWYGETEAQNTLENDLSDVAKGWIIQLKEQNPANVITGGKTAEKIILFSENADYQNLDELAMALRNKLPANYQERNDLMFFVGAELVAKSSTEIKGHSQSNNGLDVQYLSNYFGGMPAIIPPNFPKRCALVTTFKNLSIYTQKGSAHRSIYEDDERMSVINAYLRRECYVVEDLNLMAAIEHKNVEFHNERSH